HGPAALALRAGDGCRPGGGSRTVTGRARLRHRHRDGNLPPSRGRLERDLYRVLDVLAPLRRPCPTRPTRPATADIEDGAECISQPAGPVPIPDVYLGQRASRAGVAPGPESPEAATRTAELPHLVVLLTLRVIRQH